eukprot:CAMPEP_0167825454 /NCGR_PEP_ID=MMETSP0112_2-20121227/9381_1 /TAXON_ID=91324 /ORGANISM="Lotharella globosa, Strain CCCM811" /LENGTH=245 /DNA_ID=CAMNT_0007727575 /DNA_START=9 /DNA_END=746 /DNA_ORIENTATION=+
MATISATPLPVYQAFGSEPRRKARVQKRLVALATGALCVGTMWLALISLVNVFGTNGVLGSGTIMQQRMAGVSPRTTMRMCRSFAEGELKGPPSLKAPQRPTSAVEDATTGTTTDGVWKAPDKAEEEKMLQIKIKAEAERRRMEQAESAKKLRDARREIRDFANSLNDLYDDELGDGVLPSGVVSPRAQPNNSETAIGFNPTAELLNSRAAMIGFFALILVEAVTGKGFLTLLGIKIGSGIDIGL